MSKKFTLTNLTNLTHLTILTNLTNLAYLTNLTYFTDWITLTNFTSFADQMSSQQEAMQQQVQKLTDIAHRHDDEIDDLRGMTDDTHELVMEQECKESSLKMVIKSWPREATYWDRVRVADWLLQRA